MTIRFLTQPSLEPSDQMCRTFSMAALTPPQPPTICRFCPPSSCLPTERGDSSPRRAPLQAAELTPRSERIIRAAARASPLMRRFEHQQHAASFGGGREHHVHISMHICGGVFTAEEEECLHSSSRTGETSGRKKRREKRTGRRTSASKFHF